MVGRETCLHAPIRPHETFRSRNPRGSQVAKPLVRLKFGVREYSNGECRMGQRIIGKALIDDAA